MQQIWNMVSPLSVRIEHQSPANSRSKAETVISDARAGSQVDLALQPFSMSIAANAERHSGTLHEDYRMRWSKSLASNAS
jgi:hypothetical protein